MKATMALLAVMLPLVTTNAGAAGMKRQMAADGVGVSTLAVPVPERGGTMDVTLWYPAAATLRQQRILCHSSSYPKVD
jgi:predicted dienelactone hydrolase